ncbi:unnamed protein product [Linum trigynum]|uniref:Uncharacterized protein n=1 Tax=Linum trigynum TaxID=586398 RepID=A0AAV2E0F3_9ROSI
MVARTRSGRAKGEDGNAGAAFRMRDDDGRGLVLVAATLTPLPLLVVPMFKRGLDSSRSSLEGPRALAVLV